MKKYGMELEFFVEKEDTNELVIAAETGVPTDEFPILGEIRSGTFDGIHLVAADIDWKLEGVCNAISPKGYHIILDDPIRTISKELYRKLLARGFNKGPVKEMNLYGLKKPVNKLLVTAGIHIHFSDGSTITGKDGNTIQTYAQLDIPSIVRQLDVRFKDMIKGSKRQPGWYELKPYGFEYRSLPSSDYLHEIVEFVGRKLVW